MPNQVVEVTKPATSTPISGSLGASGFTSAFIPQLGRNMALTLSGTWAGSVQVQRSVDNGLNWNNTTIGGGNPWLLFTGNCDEVIDTPTDAAASYRLSFTWVSGTVNYRLAQ